MSDLRSACGVSRVGGMSNESVYEHFGMCYVGEGKKCGVVEEVKRQTLKWFGPMERLEEGKMTRWVYVSEIEGKNEGHGEEKVYVLRYGSDGEWSGVGEEHVK